MEHIVGAEEAGEQCRRLKTDNRFRASVCFFIANTPFRGTKGEALRLIGEHGRETVKALYAFEKTLTAEKNAALAAALKPGLIVVDSICGDLDFEEGGNPIQTNRMYLGTDAVQLDAYGGSLMGFSAMNDFPG